MNPSERSDEMEKEILPIGAVVKYRSAEGGFDQALLVIVQHSPGTARDPEVLYMAAKRPIAPPDENKYKLYSKGYLAYRMNAGWYVGNVDRHLLEDTGERVKVERFEVERYDPADRAVPAA